jgi:hypothetical protein
MGEMSEKRKTAAAPFIIATVLILLPVLYVLALGPIHWLQLRGYIHEPVTDWLTVAYRPLEWAVKTSPVCREWMDWYCSFWGTTYK